MKVFLSLLFLGLINEAHAYDFTESASQMRQMVQSSEVCPQHDGSEFLALERKVQERAENECAGYSAPVRVSEFRYQSECKMITRDFQRVGDRYRVYKVEADYVCPPEPACTRMRYPC
jgi:hypothetical protein